MRTLFKNFLTDEYFGTLKICFECGRFISGPSGILITRVINKKYTYKNYLGTILVCFKKVALEFTRCINYVYHNNYY